MNSASKGKVCQHHNEVRLKGRAKFIGYYSDS